MSTIPPPCRVELPRYYPTTDELPRLVLDERIEREPTVSDVLASVVGFLIFSGAVLVSIFGWLVPL